jgi:hypothetical protein
MFARWKASLGFAFLLMTASSAPAQSPHVYTLSGDVAFTHDPSIAKDGKTWYVFATGKTPEGGQFAIRCSNDLEHWKRCGQVFDAIPDWIQKRSPGTKDLWAPDVSYENHEYRMYYAYSLFGKNTSGIALAVNKTLDPTSPDFKWVDKGLVVESKAEDNFNAVDPNFIRDHKGQDWLLHRHDALLARTPCTASGCRACTSGPAAELGGHRGTLHRLSRWLLLPVYVLGSLLPWSEEHLQNGRRTREGRHRAVCRRNQQAAAGGWRIAAAGGELTLAWTGRRERLDGARQPRPDRVPCIRCEDGQAIDAAFDDRLDGRLASCWIGAMRLAPASL